jgi:hypothetical protein
LPPIVTSVAGPRRFGLGGGEPVPSRIVRMAEDTTSRPAGGKAAAPPVSPLEDCRDAL